MKPKKEVNQKYGKIIKEIRTNNNLSQQEFATLIGTTISTISSWETFKTKPVVSYWNPIIIKLFGIDITTGKKWGFEERG